MNLITERGLLVCMHETGKVVMEYSQEFVRISEALVFIEPDPVAKGIFGCNMYGAGIKPCNKTVNVQKGYSRFLRISGRRICLDTLTGLTDGTPPGEVNYKVSHPGQLFVSEAG